MTRIRSISLLLLIICITSNIKGQVPAPGPSGDLTQMLDQLEEISQKEHIPGLMISIVKKDSILYAGGIGYANIEERVRVDSTTLFHLASVTKFFIAMGIQKLVSEGKLDLNDKLHEIAPEISFMNKWESTHPIRIIHLLEHTTGFEDIHLNKMVDTMRISHSGIDAVNSLKNSFTSRWRPGERMSYSNPGYDILGYLIAKITKMPWDQYLRISLLQPLGMQNTVFDLNGTRQPSFARGYDFIAGKHQLLPLYGPSSNGASSALVSNAADMSKLMYYLLNGTEQSTVLPKSKLDQMETVHSTLASNLGLQTGYALGNDLFPNNKKITFRGHNGKGEGFVSWLFYNRTAGLAYTISANCNLNLWPVSRVIEEFLTKELSPPLLSSLPIDRKAVEPLLGYYKFMNPKNERWEFFKRIFSGIHLTAIKNDKLVVKRNNGAIDSLVHTGHGIYRLKEDIIPSLIIGKDSEGHPFVQGHGGSFYLKAAYPPIILQQIFIYLGIASGLLSIIFAIIAMPMVLFRKIKFIDLCFALLPALGSLSFLYSYRLIGQTDAVDKQLFASANVTTFSIFAGMVIFGISVFAVGYLLYKRWHVIRKRWVRYVLAFNFMFLFYLVVLLSIHGWIGVPIWTM